MKEILEAIYEYPWTFLYLCFGITMITTGIKIRVNKNER